MEYLGAWGTQIHEKTWSRKSRVRLLLPTMSHPGGPRPFPSHICFIIDRDNTTVRNMLECPPEMNVSAIILSVLGGTVSQLVNEWVSVFAAVLSPLGGQSDLGLAISHKKN